MFYLASLLKKHYKNAWEEKFKNLLLFKINFPTNVTTMTTMKKNGNCAI